MTLIRKLRSASRARTYQALAPAHQLRGQTRPKPPRTATASVTSVALSCLTITSFMARRDCSAHLPLSHRAKGESKAYRKNGVATLHRDSVFTVRHGVLKILL